MSMIRAVMSLLGLLAVVAGTPGCGPTEQVVDPIEQAQGKVLGILYGKYLSQNRGQAPPNKDQFVKFLESERANWERIVPNVEQLLTSPRDNQPLVVLYGKQLTQQKSARSVWVAYERVGVDGQRQILSARGLVEEMDETTFSQVFPQER